MIINIRGTGGAGKSTLVRTMMSRYDKRTPVMETRKQPVGYACERAGGRPLWVVGHYETACGGCDTIKTPDEVYVYVTSAANSGYDVLYEGIIVQDDTRRCIELSKTHELRVVGLYVPIEECLAGIQKRRDNRGDTRPLNPKNTVDRARRLEGSMKKLQAAGVDARWLSRDEALAFLHDQLALEDPGHDDERITDKDPYDHIDTTNGRLF